jgi:peptidoglycan-associated lipoprotein
MNRRLVVPALAAVLVLAACNKDPPPPPAPTGPTAEELAEQARRDSIAAAERAAREAAEAAAREAAAREARLREARATLEQVVYFDYDESSLRSDSESTLRAKAEILRSSPSVSIRIEGHADERGTNEYNLALGNARAESVRQFFTSFGLDASRFEIVSYGEERPAAQGNSESAWSQNRRAEFVVTGGDIQIDGM